MKTTILSLAFLLFMTAEPQSERRTVWNGVYSAAQATRGQEAFTNNCVRCHGSALTGGSAAPLKGERFFEKWREDSLQSLYNYMSTYMPRNSARLTDAVYLDIMGFVLRENGFP